LPACHSVNCSCRRLWRQGIQITADEDIGSYNVNDEIRLRSE